MAQLPGLTGRQLVRLLELDGRTRDLRQRSRHGIILKKTIEGRTRIAVIPEKRLVPDTLSRILSVKQTGIGRERLAQLIEEHGLR